MGGTEDQGNDADHVENLLPAARGDTSAVGEDRPPYRIHVLQQGARLDINLRTTGDFSCIEGLFL